MAYFDSETGIEEKIVQVNRVSKKTAGGNKMGFSVLVVVGDKQGKVGVGLGKAATVQQSIVKGVTYAKKHMISVPMNETTIPHEIYIKRGAAKILLKPASKGTGVIAGGAVRAVVEAAGVRDILSKVLGTSNQASNVYATLEALKSLRTVPSREPTAKTQEAIVIPVEKVEKKPKARRAANVQKVKDSKNTKKDKK
jgi:small subunit ribosomal protein S5